MRAEKKSSARVELMQGTLDMLILRTLLLGPAYGHQFAKYIQCTTDEFLQIEHGLCTPHCIAWNGKAGFRQNGNLPQKIKSVDSSFIGSRLQGGSSLLRRSRDGNK